MNREEAKYYLQSSGFSEEQIDTIEKAFTSTDAISRQAVIDSLHSKFADGFDSDRWWNSMSVLYAINKVPPVNPTKTGHWIFDEILDKHYYCSECKSMGVDYWDFCPSCGAKMVEPQERSDKG